MDAASFRATFPEFADTTRFPNAQVDMWLGVGARLLRPERWLDLIDHGLGLFTAHHISMWRTAMDESDASGPIGVSTGAVGAESVDKVSVTYDNSTSLEEGAGHWNLTVYGKQFVRLSRMAGMGGVQV